MEENEWGRNTTFKRVSREDLQEVVRFNLRRMEWSPPGKEQGTQGKILQQTNNKNKSLEMGGSWLF